MFESLPVVIPTLRDVARGTLRPVGTPDDAATAADRRTAVILLDARARGMPAVCALYDELELYLQAANIASLRLHRRGEGTVAQMLDILAGVTLLRSRGCQRVILIVAAEGALPSWEQSRAETLAGLLDLIRRQHSGTARELIGAIGDLVKTIRVVADSVAGVATVLVAERGSPAALGPRETLAALRPVAAAREPSTAPAPAPAGSPKALVLPLREGDDHVRAVSQLYLWCRALGDETPATTQPAAREQVLVDDAVAPVAVAPEDEAIRTAAHRELRAASTEFHEVLHWLDEQWSEMVGDMARHLPHSAARILAASSLAEAQHPHSKALRASRAAWQYLDVATRLKWLALCRRTFAALAESTAEQECLRQGALAARLEHVDCLTMRDAQPSPLGRARPPA